MFCKDVWMAIDPARSMGLALYSPAETPPVRSWVWDMRPYAKTGDGHLYSYLFQNLTMALRKHAVTRLIVERPTPQNQNSGSMQYGLIAVVELCCAMAGVKCEKVYPQTMQAFIRRMLAKRYPAVDMKAHPGYALAVKWSSTHKDAKAASVVYFWLSMGFPPEASDQADALSILLYGIYRDRHPDPVPDKLSLKPARKPGKRKRVVVTESEERLC